MNDQENYGGTCYNSSGTSTITCPVQASYSPYPTSSPTSSGSCPSGSHTMYVNSAGGYCMSDSDGSKCGPLNSSSVSNFGSCSSYQSTTSYTPTPSCPAGQWWDYSTSSCKSNSTYTYTPPPSCPSGQWWDYSSSTCKSNDSYTYTPYPTTSYTPYPTCTSGQWWDSSTNSCKDSYTPPSTTYTPYPTTEYTPPPYSPSPAESYSPPPTSSMYQPYMVAHCQQLGRTWNGETCRANGLFARIYESYTSDFATIFKVFGF